MSDTLSFSAPERVGIIQRISVRFGGSKSRELERFLKFAVVGTIGAVIDLGLTNIFLRFVFHVQPGDVLPAVISSAVGFTAAVISNFIWNRYWTYPESRSRHPAHQLGMFFAVNVAGVAIRIPVLHFAEPVMLDFLKAPRWNIAIPPEFVARNVTLAIAVGIVMLWNFFINRYWTYNDVT
jgi:putative flippase GtrA